MKSITKILLYSLCLLAVLSCQKEITHTIKVRVYNPVNNTPYANALVVIEERTNLSQNGPSTGVKINKFYEGRTDANGELNLTAEYHKGYKYNLSVVNNDYEFSEICYRNSPSFTIYYNSQSNPIQEINVELVPCAELKFKIKNLDCQNSNDSLVVYFDGSETGNEDYRIGKIFHQLGCVDLIDEFWNKFSMGKRYYHWDVTKNDITNTYYDTINLAAGEQRIYEINY